MNIPGPLPGDPGHVLLTGKDSENATLSLNIHRGQKRWNEPQIGWMDSIGVIRRESNIVRTPAPDTALTFLRPGLWRTLEILCLLCVPRS
jgi:hypothetical protein